MKQLLLLVHKNTELFASSYIHAVPLSEMVDLLTYLVARAVTWRDVQDTFCNLLQGIRNFSCPGSGKA